jgi:large subunit ribosomal protein L4
MLRGLSLSAERTLLILAFPDKHLTLASRNLQQAEVVMASQINTYDLLNAKHLIISESALASINQNLSQK